MNATLRMMIQIALLIAAPALCSSWGRREAAIVESRGGISTAIEFAAVFGPYLLGAAICGATAYWLSRSHNAAVKVALHTEPPVTASADETLVCLDAPGVSLRAKLANASAADVEFRKRVVASVAAALEVREVPAK
jgi:hypothetical protein